MQKAVTLSTKKILWIFLQIPVCKMYGIIICPAFP